MVLMVSGRTDIVAFYTEWFMNRYKEGYVDVRNPFNKKLVSRINFNDVDIIMFCTKNPIPIVKYLRDINKPILFHVTLTPYKKDIEPNVINKKQIVEAIKNISNVIGKDNIVVRYDPILVNDKYTIDYHKKAFKKLCELLDGYITKIIISFIDDYKNVRKNVGILKYKELTDDDYKEIGISFNESATSHNIKVQTCYEERDLSEYGFIKDVCLSQNLAFKLSGKGFKKWKARECGCVEMVDIGTYNSCNHRCKYCYANYNEDVINKNISKHNVNSSLLIGELENDDIIKNRV